MELFLLGTGAAWPDADRNAPSFLIRNNKKSYLIDCGGGTSHQLMKVGIPPSSLEQIFLTHIHIDHCVEFPSLVFGAYLTGKEGSFYVYGPKGTSRFADSIFNDVYDFARPMMKERRNKEISIKTFEKENGLVYEDKNIKVEATPVIHGIPTIAYKFSSNEKSIVLSSDTAPCQSLIDISKNADILVAECSFPEDFGPKPGHLIPSQVAKIATKASVKKLILVHLFPPCKGKEKDILNEVKKGFSGAVEIGYDLQKFEI